MNTRIAKEEMALMMPTRLGHYFTDDAEYVVPASDTPGVLARIGAFFGALAELPRRRAVMNELTRLTDHELADIGLTRGELDRVFDAEFAAARATSRVAARPFARLVNA